MKTALVTGITGQDGRYLAELLVGKGYRVVGMIRGQDNPKAAMVQAENPALELIGGDLRDMGSLVAALDAVAPDEVYNLGAISFVGMSFQQPELTVDTTGVGVLRLLEAVRIVDPSIRVFQASSSEMFGKVRESPQNELTPFHPRSPYGCAKVAAHHLCVNYRESYGMFVACGIMFNHESPRRGPEFVTRKITQGVARIVAGMEDHITLGNLDAQRDWGYAGDYVDAMWRILQQETPGDWVVATGETHTVRRWCEEAFRAAEIDNWMQYVRTDERYRRPAEVDVLRGDARKIAVQLDWYPHIRMEALCQMMVHHDIATLTAA